MQLGAQGNASRHDEAIILLTCVYLREYSCRQTCSNCPLAIPLAHHKPIAIGDMHIGIIYHRLADGYDIRAGKADARKLMKLQIPLAICRCQRGKQESNQ